MASPEASEGIMRRVASLLERAAHADTPQAERETAQELADTMMAKYRLDRAMLNFNRDEKEVREPMHRAYKRISLVNREAITGRKDVVEYTLEGWINALRSEVYTHCGCMVATLQDATVVGYEEDIFYGDMLWATVFQDMITRIYPGWTKGRSFDENVYMLKKAGFSWPQVREMGLKAEARDRSGPLTAKNAGSKLRVAYKRHAATLGEIVPEGRQQPANPWNFRRSFVAGYYNTLTIRMQHLKEQQVPSEEGALALVKDEDRIKQMFYKMFPSMMPTPEDEKDYLPEQKGRKKKEPKVKPIDLNAYYAGVDAGEKVNLSAQAAAGAVANDKEQLTS